VGAARETRDVAKARSSKPAKQPAVKPPKKTASPFMKATKSAKIERAAPAKRPTAAAPRSARTAKSAATAVPSAAVELLAQVLAAPDDDAPRAVYADALAEAGDPRGPFITAQIAVEAMDPLDERYAPALAAVNRTIARHCARWIGDYLARAKLSEMAIRRPVDRLGNARFRGGFLRRIAMRADHIAREWPALRAREPLEGIELLVTEYAPPEYKSLDEPRAFEVLKVSPDGWFTSNSLAEVLAVGMPRLRELDLSGCDLGAAGAELLANQETDLGASFPDYVAPPPFAPGQLRVLVLAATQLGDAGARLLFAADHLSELETLDLTQCRMTDPETLTALRDAPAMRALRRLGLAGNALGDRLAALAGWEVLPRLEELGLPQTTTPEALAALFPRPSSTLRTLALASGKAVAQAPNLFEVAEALVELDLGTTSLGDERWRALLAAPSARRLVHLHANGCSLSDAAVTALVDSALDRLVSLDLSSNKLTDAGLAALAAWPGLAHVTHLRLGNNRKLGAAGFAALAESDYLDPAVLDLGKLGDDRSLAALRARFGEAVVSRA